MCDLNFQAWILCEISRSEVMRCTPSVLQPLIDFIRGQASLFAPDSIVAVWAFFFFMRVSFLTCKLATLCKRGLSLLSKSFRM